MNSQKILINTSEWYANSTDKTLGAAVQYIASVLDSKIGGCEYVVINNYPAIKLPSVDNSISDGSYPVMHFSGSVTTDASTSVRIKIGVSNGTTFYAGNNGNWYYKGSSMGTTGGESGINIASYNIGIAINANYLSKYGFYCLGRIDVPPSISEEVFQNDWILGTPNIICKLTSIIDKSEVNAVIQPPIYGNYYIYIYVNTGSKSIRHSYSRDADIVIVDDFNCGRYYHPNLKIVHPEANPIIANVVDWERQLNNAPYGWKKSALIIGGQSYDVLLTKVSGVDSALIIPSITE